jgi:ferredoxin
MPIRFGPGPAIPCSSQLNLLAHAQLEEIDVGSRCGGFGECGGDKILVRKGHEHLSVLTSAEREHLSAEEIARGFRLACQVFPESDSAEIDIQPIPTT